MSLDPGLVHLVELLNQFPRPHDQIPEDARAQFELINNFGDLPREPVAEVVDLASPGPAGEIPVRLYRPEVAAPPPLLVYFHGGGWTIGGLESYDRVCRALCRRSGCAVASVDYRLAPEHKFPAAVDDALAATAWLAANGDRLGYAGQRLAVGGDSAGGNLAAVVCIQARDAGGPAISFQLLVYPATDLGTALRPADATASYRDYGEGLLLEAKSMSWFSANYLRDDKDVDNPLASPLRTTDLGGLPAAFVLTGELDPLRDEGEAYAARLASAGVAVRQTRYAGLPHGFFSMFDIADAPNHAMDDAARALREALR
ncbi:MAG: acetyl esterase [Chloroflexota bacterium]|jgi:acetyl esterase|nr:acetyl esterase [Chloroflexota bacterium]